MVRAPPDRSWPPPWPDLEPLSGPSDSTYSWSEYHAGPVGASSWPDLEPFSGPSDLTKPWSEVTVLLPGPGRAGERTPPLETVGRARGGTPPCPEEAKPFQEGDLGSPPSRVHVVISRELRTQTTLVPAGATRRHDRAHKSASRTDQLTVQAPRRTGRRASLARTRAPRRASCTNRLTV